MNFRRASGAPNIPLHLKQTTTKSTSLDSLLAKNYAKVDAGTRDVLLGIADGFIDEVLLNACKLALHRGGTTLVCAFF
jgi:transcription initiation factor TFIID subunit TAF12